jgi:hypothetical protein
MASTDPPIYAAKDFATPITDPFVKAYAAGSLLLDCPRITLRQNAAETPQVIHGRGMISMMPGTEFRLRMYVDDERSITSEPPWAALLDMTKILSGDIIPPEEYFALEATDLSGLVWTCAKLQIKRHGGGHGTVVTGKLYDILAHRATGLSATLPTLMSMFFFEDLAVPLNQFVETRTTSGERTLSSNLIPKFAKFEAGGYRFEVQRVEAEKGSTIMRVYSPAALFPEGIETRVEESLRYVTFNPIKWCIIDKQHNGTREVLVVPHGNPGTSIFDEPLDHGRPDCAVDYWRLFAAYFLHVVAFDKPLEYHPLSAQLYHVISAETQQLDLKGLLVSVAVEGVLNVEFADLAKPSAAFKAAVDSVNTIIRRLKCADEGLAKRLQGMLPGMNSSRPKDKFKLLTAADVITAEMVRAWEKLRNTTAHASVRFDPTEMQTNLNRCNMVYTMLNLLIFEAIGYSGRYQDFSVRGWPIEHVASPKL